MNILCIHPHFTYPSGSGRFVLEVMERIARMGHEVTVLAQQGDDQIIQPYSHVRFDFVGGPLPNKVPHWAHLPMLLKKLRDRTTRTDFDVLMPSVFPASYWGMLLKRSVQAPCIWYCHEPSAFVYNREVIGGLKGSIRMYANVARPVMTVIDKSLINRADHIISNSHFTRRQVRELYDRESPVIYPGVDALKFAPSHEKGDFVFSVSRLTKFKQIDVLLKAMQHLTLPLYIGGDGEEKNNLVALAERLGITDRVTFLGRLSEHQLRLCYSRARVVVFLAQNEPFGIVPLEAMASGTPVIASASGGPCETIIDGKTGILIRTPEELVPAIEAVTSDISLNRQLSANARHRAESEFSWEHTSEQLSNFLETHVVT